MLGAVLKATNSSFQKGMTFCRSIYVEKVMKLLAFIFEQPSYKGYLLVYFKGYGIFGTPFTSLDVAIVLMPILFDDVTVLSDVT